MYIFSTIDKRAADNKLELYDVSMIQKNPTVSKSGVLENNYQKNKELKHHEPAATKGYLWEN